MNKCLTYHNVRCMTCKLSRKKKAITDKLSNGDKFKVIRRPFKFPNGKYFWLVGMVASKSNRALKTMADRELEMPYLRGDLARKAKDVDERELANQILNSAKFAKKTEFKKIEKDAGVGEEGE